MKKEVIINDLSLKDFLELLYNAREKCECVKVGNLIPKEIIELQTHLVKIMFDTDLNKA